MRELKLKSFDDTRQQATTKGSTVALNQKFHKGSEGVYSSFWLSKLVGMFITQGKKKTATRHFYKALVQLKYQLNRSPALLVLELLEKLKPTFKLRKLVIKRTVK